MVDCDRLWLIMVDRGRLWSIVVDCGQLRSIAVDCGRLWPIVVDCGRLCQIAANCGLLLSIVVDCSRLRPIAADCSRLRPMGKFTKSDKSDKSTKSISVPFHQASSSNITVHDAANINVRGAVNRLVVKGLDGGPGQCWMAGHDFLTTRPKSQTTHRLARQPSFRR